jgi:translocation and assembly module TamA
MVVRRLSLAAALFGLVACAGVEKGQYGVDALDIAGMEQMDQEAVKRCLLTTERETAQIPLGMAASECNEPPFDDSPPAISLWRWPWTDWPIFNAAVIDVDRKRIERWYRARGFYDARVTDISYVPKEAGTLGAEIPKGQCDPQKEECTVEVTMTVQEGAPLLIGSVTIEGLDALPPEAREIVGDAELPGVGDRFDELEHDKAKRALLKQLAESSYAGAAVEAEVQLDHTAKLAHVRYRVTPGPAYRYGRVNIYGEGPLQKSPIHAAAGLKAGEPYRESALIEVQQEIYALGAFSVVEVERVLNVKTAQAHIHIKVTPLPFDAFRVGVGVTSGALQRTESGQVESVPQWDVHLLGRYERRHIFNTLGKLRIEDRPRLIFPSPFPETNCDPGETCPAFGNLLRVRLNQPGVLEARTDLIFETQWDYGPEPFLGFFRHDVMGRVSAKRAFLRRNVFGTFAVQHDRFIVQPGESYFTDERPTDQAERMPPVYEVEPDSYVYSFIEQDIRLDLRDDDVQPRKGIYLGLLATQSVRAPISDWTMLRLLPEARGYIPLPFHMVIALRFAVGANFVLAAKPSLDGTARRLGPTNYRLRGGGAQSNRGYVAGELGAGVEGGLRRWESAAELRIRLGGAFGVVGFFDMGDVNDGSEVRFSRTNPSAGFGLRYLTIVGAIRFDMGFRLQPPAEADPNELFIFDVPGAMHLTLGEAF